MQENKSNVDIASDAITGGVVGGVAGGTIGAVVGGTSGYINRRRELNRLLKPAMTPDETINSLHDEIAKHADEDVFKTSIKNGDLTIDQVYQKDGSLNPELAKGRFMIVTSIRSKAMIKQGIGCGVLVLPFQLHLRRLVSHLALLSPI
jgi:hypothetical protein